MDDRPTLTLRDEILSWFAAAGAAAAWVVHFVVSYFFSEGACSTGDGVDLLEPLVLGLTVGLGGVAVAAGLAGLFIRRRAADDSIPDPRGRLRWMGLLGMISAVIFLFAILLEGIQVTQLSCEAG